MTNSISGSPLVGEGSGHSDRFGKDVDPSYFETFLGQPHREHARTAPEVERARATVASGYRRDEHATRTFAMPRQPLRLAVGLAIEAVHHALRDAHLASFLRPPDGSFLAGFLTDVFAACGSDRFGALPTLIGAGRACCG